MISGLLLFFLLILEYPSILLHPKNDMQTRLYHITVKKESKKVTGDPTNGHRTRSICSISSFVQDVSAYLAFS